METKKEIIYKSFVRVKFLLYFFVLGLLVESAIEYMILGFFNEVLISLFCFCAILLFMFDEIVNHKKL